ncbi:PREDICTED: uncharacterized protein LOC109583638 [Amphimedon queenslandica]|uniref:Fibronectin type-III domain-containing protein n=1 Tax=Amphimedon queenslandica TaxID=400682 RepID=A0AAN0JCZ6_AMPQE|nr:PREDICTED: uncharacterized protein LOC109583638 [Amphimedon queenslandica]|eukprot:XP_019854621.1 PREDICTED: uncharacterized protein LOC109583638 [Amphimedon queenslandica]
MNYTITVRAGNVPGASNSSMISAKTSLSKLCGMRSIVRNSMVDSNEDGAAIGLAITVALLMILLTISLVVHVYCFIKLKYPAFIATETNKSTAKDENKIIEDIKIKECESYRLHELSKAVVYEECLPADDQFPDVSEPTTEALYNYCD